jgi:hypothetical protein
VCTNGVSSHPNLPQGTPCGIGMALTCDGTGDCSGCTLASQCGQNDFCRTYACTSNECTTMDAPLGAVLPANQQATGDCQRLICDGFGGVTSEADDTDLPPDDGIECTLDTCVAGAPQHPPQLADTPCAQNGGSVCNANGSCVQCNASAQCDASCGCRVCSGGNCVNTPAGTPASCQVPGDCKLRQCNGSGGTTDIVNDADTPPEDGNACTDPACNAGVPSYLANNAPCDDALFCNGNDTCSGGSCSQHTGHPCAPFCTATVATPVAAGAARNTSATPARAPTATATAPRRATRRTTIVRGSTRRIRRATTDNSAR